MVGDMPLPAKFFIAFVIVLALIGGVAWLVRRFGSGGLGSAAARGRQARLGVIEATAVDSRRRLVLVRRDNVEHLIMLGGPSDLVVEANIVRGQPAAPMRDVPTARMEQPGRPGPDSGLWSVAPEPSFRNGRPERGMIQPVAEDLPLQPQVEPGPRPQTVDRLAGLAAELSRSPPPAIVEPRAAEARLGEPRMSEPRLPDSRMPDPRIGDARMGEPHPGEPRLHEPRMPEPRLPEPRRPDARTPEPRMPEPRVSEPRMSEARMSEPRMPEPRIPEPRMPEARVPEPRPAEARRPGPELRRPLESRRPP
ncbi:flagellar biosynthetic protein FliO, partial [Rhodoplanes roseus]|uniref:flagellar biosynthetic protein FliO n=1 Tax=Rhodoplanes roseus TaxID=29409 RepID=UPI001FE0C0DC